ncbi:hypothetical protein FQA47_006079 [Oryzias melastigma]|uniref:Uncharacterized protein n=1 Tax=Oryzias melastigma TaxID=30732 RepID=A0A834CDI6_ORYME|nr:hypothetical protein FQA47_006079 [Oryzias melastigma]
MRRRASAGAPSEPGAVVGKGRDSIPAAANVKSQRPDVSSHLRYAPLSSPTLTIMDHHGRLDHPVSQTEGNISKNTQSKQYIITAKCTQLCHRLPMSFFPRKSCFFFFFLETHVDMTFGWENRIFYKCVSSICYRSTYLLYFSTNFLSTETKLHKKAVEDRRQPHTGSSTCFSGSCFPGLYPAPGRFGGPHINWHPGVVGPIVELSAELERVCVVFLLKDADGLSLHPFTLIESA